MKTSRTAVKRLASPIAWRRGITEKVVRIRLAGAEETASISALIDSAYRHYIPIIGRTPRPMLDDHAARIARDESFVAEEDEKLLAVITMAPQPEALHIFNIAVSPDAQGRGLLRQLLAFAESEARRPCRFRNPRQPGWRRLHHHLHAASGAAGKYRQLTAISSIVFIQLNSVAGTS